ncbi:MAG: valine--tRNA ligase [Bacteroidota bacterium]
MACRPSCSFLSQNCDSVKPTELPKQYDPASVETHWYTWWESNGYFHSEPDDRESYTVVIPPPNVTGVLHMGHMLNNTIQDVLVRRARMQGKNACWVAGTDHASIATEAKVVQRLREQGIKKSDLTRDDFLKHAWKWTDEHGGIILQQLRKLGASCDWERTRFTLEEELYESVIDCFIELYDRGHIYRGLRMIHWDPVAKTALSDEEVIHKEEQSNLYHIRYPIEDSDGFVTIATTRPETILADTAICVHPDDKRYASLVGQRVRIPLTDRTVPVIRDDYVDPEFGTGCLKVTPAHDVNDYEIGQRHDLEVIDMLEADGTVSPSIKTYAGMDRFDARKAIVKDLKSNEFLVKTEQIANKVGTSERTGAVIEPRLSLQWFCRMEELAKPALDSVESGEIRFHPDKFVNSYRHWMENIRDWCISRQLWWGHRIPAWYFGQGNEEYVIAKTAEEALKKARTKSGKDLQASDLKQDEDVLDTWFSSWLWPITVFGGLKDPKNKDIEYYYPTQDLVTAPEIMFFWVARMIMAGYAFRGTPPFRNVYYHGIVRDEKRRKMSKSLGNSPDPLELIDSYGADGTRVGMLFSSPAGNDLLFDEKLCEQGRNFANKIWNAFRFLSMNKQEGQIYRPSFESDSESLADRWMESRLQTTLEGMNQDFERYRLNDALQKIYSLIWDDYCDWYIEMIKPDEGGDKISKERLERALGIFGELMKLLHPFMPFITEEIWHKLGDEQPENPILVSSWPEEHSERKNPTTEDTFSTLQEIISAIRNIQANMGLSPKTPLTIRIQADSNESATALTRESWIIEKLIATESLEIGDTIEKPSGSVTAVIRGHEIYIPLEGLIDLEKERTKIEADIEKTKGFLNSVQRKLSNENFVKNAPDEVVQRERDKESDASDRLDKLSELLRDLS